IRDWSVTGVQTCALPISLQARPWGTTGLNFFGLPAQSAASIERQDELAQFCRDALALFVSIHAGLGSRAAAALKFVRDLIRDDRSEERRVGEGGGGRQRA